MPNYKHPDGGQVFPRPQFAEPGTSLRDWIAVEVLKVYLANPATIPSLAKCDFSEDDLCSCAYEWADGMVKARDARKDPS